MHRLAIFGYIRVFERYRFATNGANDWRIRLRHGGKLSRMTGESSELLGKWPSEQKMPRRIQYSPASRSGTSLYVMGLPIESILD